MCILYVLFIIVVVLQPVRSFSSGLLLRYDIVSICFKIILHDRIENRVMLYRSMQKYFV